MSSTTCIPARLTNLGHLIILFCLSAALPTAQADHKAGHNPGGGPSGGNGGITNPAWVVSHSDPHSLHIMSMDGATDRLTSPGDKLSKNSPAWSPTGASIAYFQSVRNGPGPQLRVVRPDGSGNELLYQFDVSASSRPITHDGLQWIAGEFDRLLYSGYDFDLYVVSSVAGTSPQPLGLGDYGGGRAASLSPDMDDATPGFQGALAYWDTIVRVADGPSGLEVDFNSAVQVPAISTLGGEVPAWSNDGSEIAYAQRYSTGGWELAVLPVDLTGSDIVYFEDDMRTIDQNFFAQGFQSPTWSPDNSLIAYVAQVGGEPGGLSAWDLFYAEADGTSVPMNVTNGSSRPSYVGWNPQWENEMNGIAVTAVPEPTAFFFVASAVMGLLFLRRPRMQKTDCIVRTSSSVERRLKKLSRCRIALLSLVLGVIAPGIVTPDLRAAEFIPLGFLPGDNNSWPNALSADGTSVVGHGTHNAFRWSQPDGMLNLGDLVGGFDSSIASDVSGNGSIVVGSSDSTNGGEAFRWTEAGGIVGLGNLPGMEISHALGISSDGSVVVGTSGNSSESHAFVWTESSGMAKLDTLTGYSYAVATAVSGDGSIVVGSQDRISAPGFAQHAVRWANGSVDELGVLPGYDNSIAWGVSANGAVIVGWSEPGDNSEAQAFRWTEGDGIESLGWLPGHTHSAARDASADGTVIIGESSVNNDSAAFLWTSEEGMQPLADMLTDLGVELSGWNLTTATGVSDDGNTIAGWGVNPSGDHEGWVARLDAVPEPSTVALAIAGLLAFAVRARRTQ